MLKPFEKNKQERYLFRIGCEPIAEENRPSEGEPGQGVNKTYCRVHSPKSAAEAGIFLCLLLFFGVKGGYHAKIIARLNVVPLQEVKKPLSRWM